MKYLKSVGSLLGCGAILLGSLLFMAGCATTGGGAADTSGAKDPGVKAPRDATSLQSPDELRVGELILVEFSGVGDPPPRHEERIKTDGKVTLPSIGPIQAAGQTRGELEEAIHSKYVPSYYRQLTVIVRNEGRFFYVKGQVRNPNQFQYLKEMTLTKAIAVAGDFTDFAKKTKVMVTRADGRKMTVNAIKAMHDPKFDVAIYPDDTIEVPRRYF